MSASSGLRPLRNIALTTPYMHDGSVAMLEEVLDRYGKGGRMTHANRTPAVRPFELTAGERSDLIEFLKSLTDEEMLCDPRWSDPWLAGARALTLFEHYFR